MHRLAIAVAALAITACHGGAGSGWNTAANGAESTVVLARTPDTELTVADLREILARLSTTTSAPDARKVFERAIEIEVLSAEARRRGYGERVDVAWQIKNVLASAMTKDDAERVRGETQAMSDDDAHAYYLAHQEELARPFEQVRSEIVRLASRERVRDARDALIAELRRGVVIDEAAVANALADPTLVSVTPVAPGTPPSSP